MVWSIVLKAADRSSRFVSMVIHNFQQDSPHEDGLNITMVDRFLKSRERLTFPLSLTFETNKKLETGQRFFKSLWSMQEFLRSGFTLAAVINKSLTSGTFSQAYVL